VSEVVYHAADSPILCRAGPRDSGLRRGGTARIPAPL